MATFTALNGGSPKTSEATVNGGAEGKKAAANEERGNSQPAAAAPEPQPATEKSTGQRENWTAPAADRPSYQSPGYPDVEGSHKRKRSNSAEPRRDHHPLTQERSPDSATQPPPEPRDPYTPQHREYRQYGEAREHSDSWRAQQGREERRDYDSNQNSASSAHGQMEEQLGEALPRGSAPMDLHGDYPQTSPDGDDRSMAMYSASYSGDQRRDPMLQSDPKKRKRNFSNRTKTGCLTCRKRKKKCDEQKPECKRAQ